MELKSVEDTSWLQLFIKNTALCKHESGRIRCDACPIRRVATLQSPMFLINSRYPLFYATYFWLPRIGHPYSEVTGAFCRVPSTSFSQAPWYSLPAHLCRFRVRS